MPIWSSAPPLMMLPPPVAPTTSLELSAIQSLLPLTLAWLLLFRMMPVPWPLTTVPPVWSPMALMVS